MVLGCADVRIAQRITDLPEWSQLTLISFDNLPKGRRQSKSAIFHRFTTIGCYGLSALLPLPSDRV
jgi:hypothetical protein